MILTKMRLKRLLIAIAFSLLLSLAPAAVVVAVCNPNAQSCSSTYQVTESFFGSGGQFSCSGGQYCANQSAGELTVGKVCDSVDQKCLQAGFNTDRSPYLEIFINTTNVDAGVLDTAETHVGTATFQVKSYLANSYQVVTNSPGPQNASHTMAFPASPTASAVGTEQFGMNLKANSCPVSTPAFGTETGSCPNTLGAGTLGDNPSQQPDSTFGFGYAATGYDSANSYMYQNGDTIARSDSSSGTTLYTISYIFNISNLTQAGRYTMNQSLIATSTF